MRRFLASFALGLTLAATVSAAGLGYLLHRANEAVLWDFDALVRRDDILWGPAFFQSGAYKLARYEVVRPDLLILGSSRVTQFRDFMMPSVRMYNASVAATSVDSARAFVDTAFRRHKPKLVLLGVDPWWFSPGPVVEGDLNRDLETGINWRTLLANALRKAVDPHFVKDLHASHPFAVDPVGGRRPMGYLASYLASGFRPDGSRQYGEELIVRQPYYDEVGMGHANGFRYYREKIRSISDRFGYVGPIDGRRLADLAGIIRTCRSQGVDVVLTLGPFPHAVYEEIQGVPQQRDYYARVDAAMARLARDEQVALFNFHDLAALGVGDEHSIDDIHVDEIATAVSFLRMREGSPALSALVPEADVISLRRRLADPAGWATPNIMAP